MCVCVYIYTHTHTHETSVHERYWISDHFLYYMKEKEMFMNRAGKGHKYEIR